MRLSLLRCPKVSRLAWPSSALQSRWSGTQSSSLASPRSGQQQQITTELDAACSYDVINKDWVSSPYHLDKNSAFGKRTRKTFVRVGAQKGSAETGDTSTVITRDDSGLTALLFPGQGCQRVGMAKEAVEKFPSAMQMFRKASNILGYDLLKTCLEGPQDKLDRTVFCQPAVFVASLAAVEVLFATNADLVKNCVSTAGFSLGEITALVFAGALTFEDGVRLIQVRASAMDQACQAADSGMITVFHGSDAKLSLAMAAAKKWARDRHGIRRPVCCYANYLYPGARVIAGHRQCLDFINQNQKDFGIRKLRFIQVTGAFHTPLMESATQALADCLSNMDVKPPRITVFSGVTGRAYKSASDIQRLLPNQLVKPVRWLQTVNAMFRYDDEAHLPSVFECGPGSTLVAMLQKINGKVAAKSQAVKV